MTPFCDLVNIQQMDTDTKINHDTAIHNTDDGAPTLLPNH